MEYKPLVSENRFAHGNKLKGIKGEHQSEVANNTLIIIKKCMLGLRLRNDNDGQCSCCRPHSKVSMATYENTRIQPE